MNFILGFIAGITAAAVLIAIAKRQQYITFGKGARADQVDDDAKALKAKVLKETP